MIRRGFWLTVGAAAGIMGYRRVSAVGRRLSGRLTGGGTRNAGRTAGGLTGGGTRNAGPTVGGGTPHAGRVGRATGLARETVRFARDVRVGMELYTARHPEPPGRTLGTTDHNPRPKDGR